MAADVLKKAGILIAFMAVIFGLTFPMANRAAVTIENPLQATTFEELFNKIVDFLFYIALGVAPIMIVVAGYYFIMAEGDPKKLETAKNIIKWTLIGLLIIICAKGIMTLFKETFLKDQGGSGGM